MVPTPTPAPPIPMQAMPAPIIFAAVTSMMNLLLVGVLMARVNSIVKVDAGEDGEDVGLEECDQELKRRERNCEPERQHRAHPAEEARSAQHGDEGGKHLEGDVAGQH